MSALQWRTAGVSSLALLERVQKDLEDWRGAMHQKDKRFCIAGDFEDGSSSGCQVETHRRHSQSGPRTAPIAAIATREDGSHRIHGRG